METIAFMIKKVVSTFLEPPGFSLLLLCVGLAVWKLGRKARVGALLIIAGVLTLFVLSIPITADHLLRFVEARAGSYRDPASLSAKGVRYIVVLGGAGKSAAFTPADRTGASIFRVIEGVRLWQGVPGSTLVMSGMGFPLEANDPNLMKALPMWLGVPDDKLIIHADAWDTVREADMLERLLGKQPFALVSAAYHMPRALLAFRSRGLHPIASPCEFRAQEPPPWYSSLLPDATALLDSQLVIHELLGIVWIHVLEMRA